MRVAVYTQHDVPPSYRVYRENVARELPALGVEVIPFGTDEPVPSGCGLIWNPGGRLRNLGRLLAKSKAPVVVSIHGPAPFALSPHELRRGWVGHMELLLRRGFTAYHWSRFRSKVAALIAPSNFGAEEAMQLSGLEKSRVFPIYHGVDHTIFTVDGEKERTGAPYFFHVSAQDQPRKNVERVFEAYSQLPSDSRPNLVVVLPGFQGTIGLEDVRVIDQRISQADLARWYRGALGFVFPSLHETFGMPILEAMASGCPVITANGTGCSEVAGDAALLVDPRSSADICDAMRRLVFDEALRQSLRHKSLAHAQSFTWSRSAERHRDVFAQVVTS